jgi:hypothetical protein
MSIRSVAFQWLKSNYGEVSGKIYTSKYYLPEESWPKEHVWWLQIPLKVIEAKQNSFINLICQVAPNKSEFHFLKVPTDYFHKHLKNFHIVEEKASLYLSADPKDLFVETRGKGKTEFTGFLV